MTGPASGSARTLLRGDIYWADLSPVRGSVQDGRRPVLIFQYDRLNRYAATVIVVPFTTNLRHAKYPTCVLVPAGDGGLRADSVALCHQVRAIDKDAILDRMGTLSPTMLRQIEESVLAAMGIRLSVPQS